MSSTSQVSERALFLTKEDARLAKVLPELDKTLDAEAERCWKLSEETLRMLSNICGVPVSKLRTRIDQSVLTQLAFSRHRIREARGLFWCLARGDVLENLVVFHCRQARTLRSVAAHLGSVGDGCTAGRVGGAEAGRSRHSNRSTSRSGASCRSWSCCWPCAPSLRSSARS